MLVSAAVASLALVGSVLPGCTSSATTDESTGDPSMAGTWKVSQVKDNGTREEIGPFIFNAQGILIYAVNTRLDNITTVVTTTEVDGTNVSINIQSGPVGGSTSQTILVEGVRDDDTITGTWKETLGDQSATIDVVLEKTSDSTAIPG